MNKKNVLAVIPARGGSKELPRKNIKLVNGKPLIYYTIREAKKSTYLSKIVVSTDDDEIGEISSDYGIQVVKRPKKLARDETTMEDVICHVIKYLERLEKFHADIVVILQPTSPLREVEDIDGAIKKFLKGRADSVISVVKVNHPLHWTYVLRDNSKLERFIKNEKFVYRRQDTQQMYQLNGAVYVTSAKNITLRRKILDGNIKAYIMLQERSIDIDSQLDFDFAEYLMNKKRNLVRS